MNESTGLWLAIIMLCWSTFVLWALSTGPAHDPIHVDPMAAKREPV